MATSTTQSNFDAALKQIYRDRNVQKLTYTHRPAFGTIPKYESFGGRNMPVVLQYGNPQGRSASFSNAQTNRTQVRLEDFLLTRVNNYAISTIDGEVVESTRGDAHAFLSALKLKIDTTMANLADDVEGDIFRDGNGARAQIGSVTAANPMVITLSEIEEIPQFEVGMVLEADSTKPISTARTAPATATINKVDRSAGTLTTDYDNSTTSVDIADGRCEAVWFRGMGS